MSSVTTTLGDGLSDTGASWVLSLSSSTDITSDVTLSTTGTYASGGFDSLGNAYTAKPIMVIDVTVRIGGSAGGYTNNADFQVEISPYANGTGGTVGTTSYTSITSTTTSASTQSGFKYAAFAGAKHYYGIDLLSGTGSTLVFARGGTTGTIYKDGATLFSNSRISGAVTQSSIPSAPLSPSASSITPEGLTLSWTAPTDDGGTDCTILGYRINYKVNTASTWSVLVANTGSSSTTRAITGLNPETTYNFQIAAINEVTDLHNNITGNPTVYNNITAHVGVRSSTVTATTLIDHQFKIWTGSAFKKANVKVFDGTNFIDVANTTIKVWTGTEFIELVMDE